jgi:EmrB/QacA subfamily drug resistance transporter
MTDRTFSTGEPYAYRWIAMTILLISSFMNFIDVTIVNVALPSMQKSLGATSAGIEWVVAGYIMTFALGLMPFGRLGDVIGRKRIFMSGVALFTIASFLCGIAPGMGLLIAARVLQGVGGAMMVPQVIAIGQVMFPPHERAKAFALIGLAAGLASVTGPVLGGALIAADIAGSEWRPIFLINIPIGIAAVFAAQKYIPAIPAHPGMKNDIPGILIAAAAMFCVIFPLIEGNGLGWPWWTLAMVVAGVALFLVFYAWVNRQEQRGRPQLLPAHLIRNRNFAIGALVSLFFFSAVPGFFLVFAIYLQTGHGLTPLQSGVTTMPFPIGVLLASVFSGKVGFRWHRERIAAGVIALFAGIALVRIVADNATEGLNHWNFAPALALAGFGLGLAIAPLFETILAGVPDKDAGSGSGSLQAIQQAGGAFGVAVISSIFFAVVGARSAGGASPHEAFTRGLELATIYNLGCYVLVVCMVFLLKKPELPAARQQPVMVD